jgi:methylenetetrahydrofolate dehydrogenase (NADP+) / methenyltetrahydrofolate cyclohydrolase
MADIINGKAFAADLRRQIKDDVSKLPSQPGLAVVLVGEDPASQVYVKSKIRHTEEVGMCSIEHKLPAETSEQKLLALVEKLNQDPKVHGILVQLPLPDHINSNKVIQTISPHKDVDGFHVINAGNLVTGQNGFVPCTPLGCMIMLKSYVGGDLSGKTAVVVGRSNIVGKPIAHLLLQENCTVTIAHSKTKNIEQVCRNADILIAAAGRAKMIKGSWIKSGAIVIDVGINRLATGELVGDVDFDEAITVAKAITPVPGGVGPMTIACLLKNTLTAYEATS